MKQRKRLVNAYEKQCLQVSFATCQYAEKMTGHQNKICLFENDAVETASINIQIN